jgi:hypothetical protein
MVEQADRKCPAEKPVQSRKKHRGEGVWAAGRAAARYGTLSARLFFSFKIRQYDTAVSASLLASLNKYEISREVAVCSSSEAVLESSKVLEGC